MNWVIGLLAFFATFLGQAGFYNSPPQSVKLVATFVGGICFGMLIVLVALEFMKERG